MAKNRKEQYEHEPTVTSHQGFPKLSKSKRLGKPYIIRDGKRIYKEDY